MIKVKGHSNLARDGVVVVNTNQNDYRHALARLKRGDDISALKHEIEELKQIIREMSNVNSRPPTK